MRWDTLLANLPGMAYRCRNEPAWPAELVSAGCQALTGYAPEVLVGPGEPLYGSLIHEDDRAPVWDAVQEAVARKSSFELEYRIRRADGAVRWVWERGVCVDDGQVLEGFIADITERREAELRARTLFAESPLPSYLWRWLDGQLRLVDFNEAALEATAGRIREWTGRGARDFFAHAPDIALLLEEAYAQRTPLRQERRYRYRSTAAERDLVVHGRFIPPDALLVVTEDTTEQHALASKLALSQRLETVGRLAGGVAHDFNNLLTAIGAYAEVLLEGTALPAEARQDLREIQHAVAQGSRLTHQLLAFSRQQVLRPQLVDLNAVVSTTEHMLRRLIGEDVVLSCQRATELGLVRADAGQLEQVLWNLAINARDAMPGGGSLLIETRNVEQSSGDAAPPLPPGSYVLLLVRDDGDGMSDDVRARAFEPFFTTKLEGKGSGLGLATVYGIVEQSGGGVFIESRPGRGTTVRVFLPRCTAEEEGTAARASNPQLEASSPVPERPPSVLVVDDDRAVRTLVARILSEAGHSVRAAPDSGEALAAMQEEGPFDLLLTDLVMPGLSGIELARRLTAHAPDLRVLFMSGYAGGNANDPDLSSVPFLAKPFSGGALLERVNEALAQPPFVSTGTASEPQ